VNECSAVCSDGLFLKDDISKKVPLSIAVVWSLRGYALKPLAECPIPIYKGPY
jgi:hypothetical protein